MALMQFFWGIPTYIIFFAPIVHLIFCLGNTQTNGKKNTHCDYNIIFEIMSTFCRDKQMHNIINNNSTKGRQFCIYNQYQFAFVNNMKLKPYNFYYYHVSFFFNNRLEKKNNMMNFLNTIIHFQQTQLLSMLYYIGNMELLML